LIALITTLSSGPYNDGYADNLSFVLNFPLQITSVKLPADGASKGHLLIDGVSPANVTVTIQATPDLATPFAPIGQVTTGADGVFHYDDTNAVSLQPMRFYRATHP